jgi:hypothetical protein
MQYLEKWHFTTHSVLYVGSTQTIHGAPYDRTTFFLDELLPPYSVVALSEDGQQKQSLSGEYLMTEVTLSPVLMLSIY